ncbi:MAG: DsbA family protein [Polaromonas sp.]|uniref:DsbA family protein n=1 Tax=Polaromonas sp. TaxID=1869339 RepID=UPI0032638694
MPNSLYYLFDPLCGWCYGATAAVSALAASPEVELHLLPSGMFSGGGARPMDDALASYAWANDQRIERLTGQPFTELYRTQVLADRRQAFDSGPATLALTAVALTAASHELRALKSIQHARYVEGRDITQLETLANLLDALNLSDAATLMRTPTPALSQAVEARVSKARVLLQELGGRGVPAFIHEVNGTRQLLDGSTVYADPQAFLAQFSAA